MDWCAWNQNPWRGDDRKPAEIEPFRAHFLTYKPKDANDQNVFVFECFAQHGYRFLDGLSVRRDDRPVDVHATGGVFKRFTIK